MAEHGERIAKLESSVLSIGTGLDKLVATTNQLAVNQTKMDSAVERLSGTVQVGLDEQRQIMADVRKGNRTNWGLIWGAAGTAVAVLSVVGGLIAYAINQPTNIALQNLSDRIKQLEASAALKVEADHARELESVRKDAEHDLFERLILEGKLRTSP